MFRKILFFFLLAISGISISQNELYIPKEFLKAYLNNTRSYDGKAVENYWINKSKYIIDVSVVTETRKVIGNEYITYFNNSPDNLSNIVIRLYQNWNKPNSSRDWNVDTNIFTTGVIIKKLTIDNNNIDLNNSNLFKLTGTNAIIKLQKKLTPKNSIKIYIEWEFQLPEVRNLRMGRYGNATYFIGYWYPQIAVYDDIYGWDLNEYTGTTEFYNDFSDYDVTISTDVKDVVIWGTGTLINSTELFTEKILNRLQYAYNTDTIIRIINSEDYKEKNIFKNPNEIKKWHFIAEKVPDFAFCFSNNYLWDATSLEVEKGRKVIINSAFKQEYKFFDRVTQISRDLLKYFSEDNPTVPYPYPSITIFNGAGGMEYPMMVNQSETESFEDLVYVTSHEISHSYFPFYMGINERLYAWMDEGWAVFLPMEFQKNYTGIDTRKRNMKTYLQLANTALDLPLMIHSNELKYEAYRFHAYNKSAFFYDVLMNMLGESQFKKILKEYINRWNGKHPTPYDFIFTFNDLYGENLNWFWKRWLFDFAYSDLSIYSALKNNDTLHLEIHNKGKLPIPLNVKITFKDNTTEEFSYSPEIWKDSLVFRTSVLTNKDIFNIQIGNEYIPDCDESDNILTLTEKQ